MRHYIYLLSFLIVNLIFSSALQAAIKFTSFVEIGGDSITSYYVADISADGSVVIGHARERFSSPHPFIYTNGITSPLTNSDGVRLQGESRVISGDGSTIAINLTQSQAPEIILYNRNNSKITAIEPYFGVLSISEDGSILGGSRSIYKNGEVTPIRIDGLTGRSYISADGSVLAATRQLPDSYVKQAVIYKDGEVIGLHDPVPNDHNPRDIASEELEKITVLSRTNAISADGSTVVGQREFYINIDDEFALTKEAFVYKNGILVGLGRLPTDGSISRQSNSTSYANDVSADGSIVVGGAWDTNDGPEALIWEVDSLAMLSVTEGLMRDGFDIESEGWDLRDVIGISADGKTIIGYGHYNGLTTSWVATITTVPVPAAVWFFTSGLGCLLGLRLKKEK